MRRQMVTTMYNNFRYCWSKFLDCAKINELDFHWLRIHAFLEMKSVATN